MVRSSIDAGACILNYAKVIGLLKDDDRKVSGVTVRDEETGTVYQVRSRCVINATGVFADEILQMDEPGKRPTVRPSQGVHLVLDSSFLQSDCAIMGQEVESAEMAFEPASECGLKPNPNVPTAVYNGFNSLNYMEQDWKLYDPNGKFLCAPAQTAPRPRSDLKKDPDVKAVLNLADADKWVDFVAERNYP